jgi:hypothetical protein
VSGRVGIELTPAGIRGVVGPAWRDVPSRAFHVPWDPAHPEAAIGALRREVPAPGAVWVAIGTGFLHVARVQLPPAPDDARERMVALEPDRFFATNDPLQVSLTPGGDVAFAVDARWLERVVRALGDWGPVVRVEPAPLAIAATLGPSATGTYAIDVADEGAAAMQLRNGRVIGVRRLPGDDAAAALGVALPPIGGQPGDVRAAWGAVRRDDAAMTGSLLDQASRRRARRRGQWRNAAAVLAALAGLSFVLAALDRSRDRLLAALDREAERLTTIAKPALEAQQRLALSLREAALTREVLASRPDPAAALAAIGAVLPRDAIILSARATGNDWQIDGTARNAAALVPLLDADQRFDNVRSLAASARFRDGGMTRESFSIALHVRPAS